MAVKKTGLGKGLDALFSTPIIEEEVENNIESLSMFSVASTKPSTALVAALSAYFWATSSALLDIFVNIAVL